MGNFKDYIATAGASGPVDNTELTSLLQRYEWFTAARIVRAAQQGGEDRRLCIAALSRACGWPTLRPINGASLTELTSDDLIDRFLREDDLRIVASDIGSEADILTEPELQDEDDIVSEEIAVIYLKQGLRKEAMETYRKLSLLNPEKSVYFAQIIAEIETNK